MMAIVLTLTMTACGKEGSDKKETDGGNGTVSSGDYVYSAQPVALQDSDGFLADFNMESLTYKDGRLYSSGYSYSFSDSGTHAIANFAPDGSDLQYSLLIGGGMQDVLAMSIGSDGNYYIARVSYSGDSVGFTPSGGGQSGPGSEEGSEAVEEGLGGPAEAGSEAVEEGPGGPAEAGAEVVEEGPVEASEEGQAQSPAAEGKGQVAEFYTEGGDSPANDPALQEDPSNGITSPAQTLKRNWSFQRQQRSIRLPQRRPGRVFMSSPVSRPTALKSGQLPPKFRKTRKWTILSTASLTVVKLPWALTFTMRRTDLS